MGSNVPVAEATLDEAVLPERVQEALGQLVGAAREGLLALSVGVGLGVMSELLEEEVEHVVGPRGKHDFDRSAVRHGRESGEVTLGGRRVQVERPRVRTADGSREVRLATYEHFADRDLLSRVVLERMLAGVSTRRYARTQEPVGTGVETKARSTSKSSVSRAFVERTRVALEELMSRRLDDVRLAVMMLDGIELKGRTNVVALGITTEGVPARSSENATVAARHLGENVSGKWTLRIRAPPREPGEQGGHAPFVEAHRLRARPLAWPSCRHSSSATIASPNSSSRSSTNSISPPSRCERGARWGPLHGHRDILETGGSAVTGYDLRYIHSDATDKNSPANWSLATGAWSSGELSHVLTGLDGGRRYDIQARAVNNSGTGPWSQTLTGATSPAAPWIPTFVYLRQLDQQLEVNWRPPAHNGGAEVTHYDVRYIRKDNRNRNDDSQWTLNSRAVLAGTTTSTTIEGLENDVEYYVQIRAANSIGPSPWTSSYRGTPNNRN